MNHPPEPRARGAAAELGAFLRAARERLRPAEFGLPEGRRRRAAGLRREEVAALCGISPTWYTWIEQGRGVAASPATLDELARGLRLTPAERAYLFDLAGRADPRPPDAPSAPPPDLGALVDAIAHPAYVLGRDWDALAWNAAAAELFADWLGGARRAAGPPPNLLQWMFLDPVARERIDAWAHRAERLVAEYRADRADAPDDPAHLARVRALRAASPDFDRVWRSRRVLAREGGERAFRLSDGTLRRLRQFTWRLADRPDVKLVMLLPDAA